MILPTYSYEIDEYAFEVWDHLPKIENLLELSQVHGNNVVDCLKVGLDTKADGIVSTRGSALAIKTADCIPVAFISEIGTALIHAGWRGLENKILLDEKVKALNPTKIIIGPHIRLKNYEVSLEFTKNFPKSNNFKEIDGRILFDMSKEAIKQLEEFYPLGEIVDCELDTFSDPRFFSYRNGDIKKRNWNTLRKI